MLNADTFGVALDCRMRLIVISVCGRRQSRRLGGFAGYASQDAEEVGFEVAYGHLGCIALVTFSWY